MLGPKTVLATSVLAALALTGCRTVSGMRDAPVNEGILRSYDAGYDDVTRAATDAVRSIGLSVEEVDRLDPNTWRLIATAGPSAFSWGELVRVSVQQRQATPVSVWVLTKRRLATNITAKDDYSPDIFLRMDFTLRRAAPSASWAPAPTATPTPSPQPSAGWAPAPTAPSPPPAPAP
jgi:hypothetical protein